jgi:hypothetical protein
MDFNDSNGTPVFIGDKIKILNHHNHIFNNQIATVFWDSRIGQFGFKCDDKQLSGWQDFHGVGKFIVHGVEKSQRDGSLCK